MMVAMMGGPNGTMKRDLEADHYVMLKMGFGILHVNYSGSCGYGTEQLRTVLHKMYELNAPELVELIQVVLKDRPHIDPEQVHVKGRSYSAGLVAYLGSHYPQHFKSGIILNGTLEWGSFYWSADTP